MTDPATIIAGMSARQKKALWEAKQNYCGDWKITRRHWPYVGHELRSIGLCDWLGFLKRSGLAVRAALRERG